MIPTRFRPGPRGLAIAAAALVLAGVPAALVLAQGTGISTAGALVNVTATGGDVRAAGADVVIRGTATSIQAAGALVDVRAEVAGAVTATGAQVGFDGTAGGDLVVGGAVVAVRGRVGGGADVGGAVVRFDAVTGGRLRIGGASVTLGPTTEVGGALQANAASLLVEGRVAGPVELHGAVVTFNGRADGAVTVGADTVVIGPQASIGGDLLLRTKAEPQVAPGAVITGVVRHIEPDEWWSQAPPWAWRLGLAAVIVLGTVVAGIVMMILTGNGFATAVGHARLQPVSSMLIGLAALVLIPFAAIFLMSTLIGLTVGLGLLLVMPLLFVFGHAVAAAGIAAGVFIRGTGRIGGGTAFLLLVIGAIALVAIGFIPVVGPILLFLALLLGLGALVRTVGRRLRTALPEGA